MATDVSFLSRMLNGGDGKDSGEPTAMITRDLLSGRFTIDDSEELNLDLDVHVPSGWEKRLDLKSGKVYIHRCDSMKSSSSSSTSSSKTIKVNVNDTASKLQDLNFPASTTKQPLNSNMSDLNLNLLLSPSATPAPSPVASSSSFHSVCTLDKVKSALERAEKEEARNKHTKRGSVSMMSSSSQSHSSSSVKVGELMEGEEEVEEEDKSSSSAMYAASCPNCLLYVLVFKNNPKCPRCQVTVPSPTAALKKPRIDLNISL